MLMFYFSSYLGSYRVLVSAFSLGVHHADVDTATQVAKLTG